MSLLKSFFRKKLPTKKSHYTDCLKDAHLEVRSAELYWNSELIEWINKCNDAEKLSVASCLVNTYSWPDWLPGKPEGYPVAESDGEYNFKLQYIVDVYRVLKDKAEVISPGLYQKIWLTSHYNKYKPE